MTYRVGDRVRVAARHHEGHHRTPGYCKGKTGCIERDHGSFTNPETRAYGGDGLPEQRLYSVGFTQRRLPGVRRHLRALAGGSGMSGHDHDHDHAPITNGDEPEAAARARALEQLLLEKGAIRREDVRARIDALVSRTPADGARRRRARLGRSRVQAAPARRRPRSGARARARARDRRLWSSPSRTPRTCTTWSSARFAPAIPAHCSGRRRTGTRASPTARAPSPTRAGCSRSSGSSSTTTSSCACSTRRRTSATS